MKYSEVESVLSRAIAAARRGPAAKVRESDRRIARAAIVKHCFFCGHLLHLQSCADTDRTTCGERLCGCVRRPDEDAAARPDPVRSSTTQDPAGAPE